LVFPVWIDAAQNFVKNAPAVKRKASFLQPTDIGFGQESAVKCNNEYGIEIGNCTAADFPWNETVE